MIDLTIAGPSSVAIDSLKSEDAFLWAADAKPLPAPSPSDEHAQEIAINAGAAEELRLLFDVSEADFKARVDGVCNSLYVTDGLQGISEFSASVHQTGVVFTGRVSQPIPPSAIPKVRGEQVYVNAAATPKRHAIGDHIKEWQRRHEAFVTKAIDRVQLAAVGYANGVLDRSLRRTLTEAQRYFQLHGPRAETSTNTLVSPNARLTGPELSSLVEAMVGIAAIRRELDLFESERLREERKREGMGGRARTKSIVPTPSLAIAEDLRALLDSTKTADVLVALTGNIERTSQALAIECAKRCRLHPVLYKLWNQPVVLAVDEIWSATSAADRLPAIEADGRLKAALLQVLSETSAAAHGFVADLRANPDEAWHYEPAIYGGLRALHLNESDLAWRAVDDRIENMRGAMTPLQELSLGLGMVELLAATAAVAPPVAVVLAVLSIGAGIAELIESAIAEARKTRAFNACLNPADSLVVQGGSYASVVIGALFIVLQIRGTTKAIGKAVPKP